MTQRNHTGSQEENRPRGFYSFLLCVLDFGLLNAAFFVLNYWKRGTFDLSSSYFNLLIGCYVIWIFVAILTKKFKVGSYGNYWDCIALYVRSGLYGAYCTAFVVVMFSFSEFSRLHAFGTWGLLALQEGVIFSVYYAIAGRRRPGEMRSARHIHELHGVKRSKRGNFSRFLLVSDFVLVGVSFFFSELPEAGQPISLT